MHSETLAEVKRLCRLVASTEKNYVEYNSEKKKASNNDPFNIIQRWQGCDIYGNSLYYIVIYHYKNALELYKIINP